MEIHFCNSNDKEYQRRLNALLKPIFLDFQFWYDLDLCDENYESYSIMQDDAIVSNVCIFKVKGVCNGAAFEALSLGAVATRADCRGRGYARVLIKHIITKHPDMPMYLYANESVLDFYTRFDFARAYEKLPTAVYAIHNENATNKLAYTDPKLREYVYHNKNLSERFDCVNTQSVNMFHLCEGAYADCLYEISECETLVIAQQNGGTLHISSMFSRQDVSFATLAKALPFCNVSRLTFGFMPPWADLKFNMESFDADPLFVRGFSCDLGDFKIPELSFT